MPISFSTLHGILSKHSFKAIAAYIYIYIRLLTIMWHMIGVCILPAFMFHRVICLLKCSHPSLSVNPLMGVYTGRERQIQCNQDG